MSQLVVISLIDISPRIIAEPYTILHNSLAYDNQYTYKFGGYVIFNTTTNC